MNNIKKLFIDIRNVDKAMKKLDPDFGGFYVSKLNNILFNTLKIIFEDKNDWIGYYVYELDWGKNWKKGTITEKGKDVKLKTTSDLYNILVK